MEITDVRIRKIDVEGKMKAVVSVTFDNEFVVHDIKVIESQGNISREEIEKIVREILDKMNLTGVINQVHIENLINFFINFSKTSDLDFGKMKTQLENLSKELAPKLKEILKDAEESGLLDKIIAFFKDLFSRFSSFFD